MNKDLLKKIKSLRDDQLAEGSGYLGKKIADLKKGKEYQIKIGKTHEKMKNILLGLLEANKIKLTFDVRDRKSSVKNSGSTIHKARNIFGKEDLSHNSNDNLK